MKPLKSMKFTVINQGDEYSILKPGEIIPEDCGVLGDADSEVGAKVLLFMSTDPIVVDILKLVREGKIAEADEFIGNLDDDF